MSHNKSHATTARNKARLMELLKDPSNKHCADCKTSRNPRWASWNLGMFICIRCSGIHRSLGTHITRVKSVDLDSWTDEQTDSMCNWGNKRANSYWEAKLKPRTQQEVELGGYVPLDAKVESFVRTKYVLGKWKDDGTRDPSRYSGDANSNRVISQQQQSPAQQQQQQQQLHAQSQPQLQKQQHDPLASLLDIGPPKAVPFQQSVSTSSLLDRPSNVNRSRTNPTLSLLEQHSSPSTPTTQQQQQQQRSNNRPDLKKSILSLYSSSPSPSASNVSLGGGYSNGANTMYRTTSASTAGSNSNLYSNMNPLINNNNATNSASNIWNSSSDSNSSAPSKNLIGDDPFKNVWN
ncbi:hypothetical protein C6P40_005514 [Pichia californica]|uniref:Arf-GAP domain-containing protein n=1 Tax=Pichia californica TaxID=460514 RepID=A0A9P6WLH2_9ASCO|nr:hypothetical protein C6P42_004566 [[Candida] californica]KAG0689141.1 hypothetical protein C6P40_005514 [[Candida] californica]